jgi:hypothetical protein
MKFIPTSAARVKDLKKRAKKLQSSKHGGKHSEWLECVAKEAGYNHWHHVIQCERITSGQVGFDALIAACTRAVEAAREGRETLVNTGPDTTSEKPWVLFSTVEKDAWLLDIHENLASCLLWHGEDQSPAIVQVPNDIRIAWDGGFELSGDFFMVDTPHAVVGTRAIGGYPVKAIREINEREQYFEDRFASIFLQPDAVDLTPEVIADLVRAGWEEKHLREMAAEGGRFSPSRNTILLPMITGGFDDDDDLDIEENPTGKPPVR